MPERVELPASEPWARLPGETARQFAAFQAYLNLPAAGRSVDRAFRAYKAAQGKHTEKGHDRTFGGWAGSYRWAERARAFDEFTVAVAQKAKVEALVEEAGRAARIRSKLLAKLEERLDTGEVSASALPEFVRALNGLLDAGPRVEAELRAKDLLPPVVVDVETGEEVDADEEDERLSLVAAEERLAAAGARVVWGDATP